MNVIQTNTFKKQVKKLQKNQKTEIDAAVRTIMNDPYIGEMKKGDLSDVYVYKFKMINQLTLLAYRYIEDEIQIILLAVGVHENFYRDLKR